MPPTRKVEGARFKSAVIACTDTAAGRVPEVIEASNKKEDARQAVRLTGPEMGASMRSGGPHWVLPTTGESIGSPRGDAGQVLPLDLSLKARSKQKS